MHAQLRIHLGVALVMLVLYNVIGFDHHFEPIKSEERPRGFMDSVVYTISMHTMVGDASTIARTMTAKLLTCVHMLAAWGFLIVSL
jgi:hypothetical protein